MYQDNQQERSTNNKPWIHTIKSQQKLIWYIVGFCDGEGSLHVSFRPRSDYPLNWKISLCFNITQKEKPILAKIKDFFECGTLRCRQDDVWYYEVNNQEMIYERIIPFFKQYNFRTIKNLNRFQGFVKISEILKLPIDHSSLIKILDIRDKYIHSAKLKYTREIILLKSSETTRQTLCDDTLTL